MREASILSHCLSCPAHCRVRPPSSCSWVLDNVIERYCHHSYFAELKQTFKVIPREECFVFSPWQPFGMHEPTEMCTTNYMVLVSPQL